MAKHSANAIGDGRPVWSPMAVAAAGSREVSSGSRRIVSSRRTFDVDALVFVEFKAPNLGEKKCGPAKKE